MSGKVVLNDVAYGNHERHKVDIFIPEKLKASCGVILFIHGGGWSSGDKNAHRTDAEYFSNIGYVSATMNYRFVTDELNVFDELDDVEKALETIKNICADRDISIEKVILSGGSAGAHLSMLYAYMRKETAVVKPVAVGAYCPPVKCWDSDFCLGITGEFEDWKYGILSQCCGFKITKADFLNVPQQEALKKISPQTYVSGDCVPTAVFHGVHDELVPVEHIYDFIEILKEKGVKNDLIIYENSNHALDKDPDKSEEARNMIESYAEKYF